MERKELILLFIHDYTKELSIAPSIREIGGGVGLKSTCTVRGHLTRLEIDGLITYIEKSPRTLRLTEKGQKQAIILKERKMNEKPK